MVSLYTWMTVSGLGPPFLQGTERLLHEQSSLPVIPTTEIGSLEDFQRFQNGHQCTSSRLGSLEVLPMATDPHRLSTEKGYYPVHLHFESRAQISHGESHETRNQLGIDQYNILDNQSSQVTWLPPPQQWEDEEESRTVTVLLTMQPHDFRFGFTVAGGKDKGLSPAIDKISKGKCCL
ncbi:hypothetical protein ACJMK2_036843 [Sinanodonta woodiana]|uniref:Uncharacterized protein n=1 Tax=Sinanodonta woodiana TaxID=1069815 RepID=A0ABD3WIF6_SINWO